MAGAATVLVGSGAGTASWVAYRLLTTQAGTARGMIGRDTSKPPEADGIYSRWGTSAGAQVSTPTCT